LTQEFGVHIDVFLTTKESWEASLVHWVIGKSVIPLKSHARKMGMHLNRYGLFDHAERPIARTIEEIYDALEIPIPQSLKPFLNHNLPNRRNRV
jgi:DNA polymerase/3'-5' exonuclease PolX